MKANESTSFYLPARLVDNNSFKIICTDLNLLNDLNVPTKLRFNKLVILENQDSRHKHILST